jgi:hypothetical protein
MMASIGNKTVWQLTRTLCCERRLHRWSQNVPVETRQGLLVVSDFMFEAIYIYVAIKLRTVSSLIFVWPHFLLTPNSFFQF